MNENTNSLPGVADPVPAVKKRSHHKKKPQAKPVRKSGITRKRTVWGRRKVVVDDRSYVIEMGQDGVRVTDKISGALETLQWHTLVKLAGRQRDLFDQLVPSLTEALRRAVEPPPQVNRMVTTINGNPISGAVEAKDQPVQAG